MMLIDNKYEIGEMVFLTTDENQLKRIVTGITIRQGGYMVYELSQGSESSYHVSSEIQNEKQIV